MTWRNDLSLLRDDRVNCWSGLGEITVADYLQLSERAYNNRGGIQHQRDALKTTSGRRIRARLIDDLRRGAVIPPLVIGMVVRAEELKSVADLGSFANLEVWLRQNHDGLSIIDGMQRTTALKEAVELDSTILNNMVRVEVWIAASTEALIYRMLVLNTGQVPWNLKQQLEVVYAPLVKAIGDRVHFKRLLAQGERRWSGGEFRSDSLIESYIAFGLRRTEVDTQESLADEFSRLDVADALTSRKYEHYFYPAVQMMVDLDVAFSRYNEVTQGEIDSGRALSAEVEPGNSVKLFTRGRHIFDTQAARVGLIVSVAVAIMGRVGMDRHEAESSDLLDKLQSQLNILISKLARLDPTQLGQFLALDVLAERLSRRPSSAVGRWERAFYERAFKVLIEERFDVPTLEPCWRA